jgi:hypothetical protein
MSAVGVPAQAAMRTSQIKAAIRLKPRPRCSMSGVELGCIPSCWFATIFMTKRESALDETRLHCLLDEEVG